MKVKFITLFLLSLNGIKLLSQEIGVKNQYNNMLWAGYYNSFELNSKWSVLSDLQIRTNDWQKNLSQGLVRAGLNCKFSDRINVTIGLAYFNYFISNTNSRNEYRPWEELAIKDKIRKIQIMHRYRLEERFMQKVGENEPQNAFSFNYRFRYKLDLKYPLKPEKENSPKIYLIAGNELMVNFGNSEQLNFFDQNRTSVGIHYDLTDKLALQFQYLRIWQQLSDGESINNINVIRFNLFHRISL